MSGLANRTINQALSDARSIAFLNDTGNASTDVYRDANLLPAAAFVIGEIEDEFLKYDLQPRERVNKTNFSYVANATSITIPGSITDFRHPIELWEADSGTENWVLMNREGRLSAPPATAPQFLSEWEWSEDTIKVNPCSRARAIFIRYRRQLTYPAEGDPTTPGAEDYYWALVAGVAYYAGGGTNRTDLNLQRLEGIYRKRTMDAILVADRDKQVIPVRQQSANPARYPVGGWRVYE